jgi:hypothetical protein
MDPSLIIGMGLNVARAGAAAFQTKGLKNDFMKADAAVNPIDPNQTAFLNRLRSQEQRFRAGTDPSSAWAMQNLNQQDAQRQRNLLRAGGPGSVGNLLRSGQIAGQGAAQVGAQAAAQGNQLVGMQMGMTNLIADRVYNRQRELSNRALGFWQQNRQDVQNAISGITAMLPEIGSQTQWNKNAPTPQTMQNQIGQYASQFNPQMSGFRAGGEYDAQMIQPRQIMPQMTQPRQIMPQGAPTQQPVMANLPGAGQAPWWNTWGQ